MATAEQERQEQLLKMSEHLAYEVGMLVWCRRLLGTTGRLSSSAPSAMSEAEATEYNQAMAEHNIRLESLLIHVRVIDGFLYGKPKKQYPNDLLAELFFQNPQQWHQSLPSRSPTLIDACKRIGTAVAHLSDLRIGQQGWTINEILTDLCKPLQHFLKTVPPELLSHQCKINIQALLDLQAGRVFDETKVVTTSGNVSFSADVFRHDDWNLPA
jgi:hypothetical protein